MKKRKNLNRLQEICGQNPVAKFAMRFNKTAVFSDKTKYNRKQKHNKQDVSPSAQA